MSMMVSVIFFEVKALYMSTVPGRRVLAEDLRKTRVRSGRYKGKRKNKRTRKEKRRGDASKGEATVGKRNVDWFASSSSSSSSW
jgi:hypothetical protein